MELFKKLNKDKLLEVFVIFLLSLTPLLWLRNNEVVLGHDAGFRLDMFSYFKSLFYSWNQVYGFGADWAVNKGFLMAQLPELLFTQLFGSLHWGQVATFIFWFFVMGISMYVLVNHFFPQRRFWIARIFASTLYVYNFFLLQGWFIAERAKFSLFAALPLGFLVLYKTLTRKYSPLKGSILFSLVFFAFNLGGSPPMYGSVFIVCIATFFYLTYFEYVKSGLKSLAYSVITLFLIIFTLFLLNAYWIIPQVVAARGYASALATTGGLEGVLAWGREINKFTSFLNLFRMQGIPDWYSSTHLYSDAFLNNPILVVASYFSIGVILLGLFKYKSLQKENRKDKVMYLLILIFLLGLLFAAGSHDPFGFIYVFLIKYLPGFAIFRTAFYKFALAYIFAMVFLTGYFLNMLLIHYVPKKMWFNLLGVVFIFGVLVYHYPFFTVNIFSWNKPFSTKVTVPGYVYEMSEFINKDDKSASRILLLPSLDQRFNPDNYEWGFWSLDLLPQLSFNRSVVANDTSFPPLVKDLYQAITSRNEKAFNRLAGITGINRVLWRGDVLYSDKITTSREFDVLRSNLESFSTIRLLKEVGLWKLYAVESSLQQGAVYVPNKLIETTSGNDTVGEILVQEVSELITPAVFVKQLMPGSLSDEVDSMVSKYVLEASCIYCGPGDLDRTINEIGLPDVRFLPGSTFYKIIEFKEERLFEANKANPLGRINVDLSLANKRIAEIGMLLTNGKKENLQNLININIEKYKRHIDDAISQLDLTGASDRNFYTIRIYTYLKFHNKKWPNFGNLLRAEESGFKNFSAFIDERTGELEGKMWVTKVPEEPKMTIDIQEAGKYSLMAEGDLPDSLVFDRKSVSLSKNLTIEPGFYKLEVKYPQPENKISINRDQLFQPANEEFFEIKDYDFNETYVVSFKYKKKLGISAKVIVSQNNDPVNPDGSVADIKKDLQYSDKWEEFIFALTPNFRAKSANVGFLYKSFNDDEALLIDDLKVYKYKSTQLFLQREKDSGAGAVPRISYEKVDPTHYKVQVERATDPFILAFGDSFYNGWSLYKGTTKLDNARHFSLNGYSNAWLVKEKGDYELSILFVPQKYFLFGVTTTVVWISVLIVVFIGGIVLRKRNG